jgi:Ser/Thr protein kinase RdoA (MazF antagonist)
MDLPIIMNMLNKHYPIKFDQIVLLRDGPGFTCIVFSRKQRYIVKIYRSTYLDKGIQSAEIMTYLSANGYPVPLVIPASDDRPFFLFDMDEGNRMGVLFNFIEGAEPDATQNTEEIGDQIGKLHNLMQNYGGNLVRQNKSYFIDFYLLKLHEMGYPAKKMERFAEHGNFLWSKVEKLPQGFCHGDLHTGNIILTVSGDYVILDFDLSSYSFPVFDMMTLCDTTDYFHFKQDGYEKVTRMVDKFYNGYTKGRYISNEEVNAIYDFIAIRHYQLQAQIIDVYGLTCVDKAFIDNQYNWLMKWQEQCERNIKS